MPPRSREEYLAEVQRILAPYLSRPTEVWKGIYILLLWYEHGVPHIIDGNYLRSGQWRRRAELVQTKLAAALGCAESEVAHKVDALLRSPLFETHPQRQNPLGIGFVNSLFVAVRHFSSEDWEFLPESEIGKSVFPGIRESPRSKPDVVVTRKGRETALISAKWSLRHDRLKDALNECEYFKTLAPSLKFYVVTNEYGPARLKKLLQSYCVDEVFHVAQPLLFTAVDGERDATLHKVRDLSELLGMWQ